MARPELKQLKALSLTDFDRHPVWIGCHGVDDGEPWYDETDEATFRPWTGALPADRGEGMLLVRAVLELADGTRLIGFVTPAFKDADVGTQQPHIFAGQRLFRFWGGMPGVAADERQALYAALKRSPDAIFPLRFNADANFATGVVTGRIDGFYRRDRSGVVIEH
jgi:hypothetical protein